MGSGHLALVGSEDPYQIVGDKQVRPSGPVLGIAIEALQVLHSRLARHVMPLCECGDGCVVQHDEGWAPRIEG